MSIALDGRFYTAVPAGSMSRRVMAYARGRMYRQFLALHPFDPAAEIVDVGVSDHVAEADNMLERLYPDPSRITALGLGEGEDFKAAFPFVRYRRIAAGAPLPVPRLSYALAVSNAVLEHVGSQEAQEFHLTELMRVGYQVFVTVPNGWFPVEHHTGIPFAHWHDGAFQWACRKTGNDIWARQSELMLMSATRLESLADRVANGRRWQVGMTGIPLGPFSSNLYLNIFASRRD